MCNDGTLVYYENGIKYIWNSETQQWEECTWRWQFE